MSHAQVAVRATELAEQIADEVSIAGQDWPAIERHAHSLAELAAFLRNATGARGRERVAH